MGERQKITEVAVGILMKPTGEFLLGRRPQNAPYAGWWEFPGGKLEAGESPAQALARELEEELGITAISSALWKTTTFDYTHAHVRLHVFKVQKWHGECHHRHYQDLCWQNVGSSYPSPMLPANIGLLQDLAAEA